MNGPNHSANAAIATNFTGYMNAIRGSDKYLDAGLKSDPATRRSVPPAELLRNLPEVLQQLL